MIDEQENRFSVGDNEIETLRKRIFELEADKAQWLRAEEQRLISEARFAGVFADSPIGIVVYDPQGKLLDVNATALRYLGLPDMQLLLNSNLFDSDALTPERRAMLASGRPVQDRATVDFDEARKKTRIDLRRTGIAHFEWSIVPAGRFGYLVQIQDVTQQVMAEKALQEREQLMQALFQAIPFPTLLWRRKDDGQYVLEMYNAAADELGQGRLAGYLGTSMDEFHRHEPGFPERIRRTFETGEAVRAEQLYVLRTTGEERWIRTSSAKVGDEYVLDSATDLTEMKRIESALRESEARYRWLAENAPDIIYHVSYRPSAHFDFVSPAVTPILGYTPDEFMAFDDRDETLLHPDDLPRLVALREGTDTEPQTLRWRHKNGEYIWLEHRFVPIRNEKGEVVAGEGVARDVNDRVRAQDQLEQSLHEKDLLLKEIHHRVKNNLAIVSGLLDLQSATTDDEVVRSALITSQKRILAVARLHEVLYRSQDVGQINLSQYIRTLTAELCNALGSNEVLVEYDLARVKVPAQNAVYLGLILNELLSNAFKHAFPSGTNGGEGVVRVSLQTENGSTTIVVGDNGIGLPPDFARRSARSLGFQVVTLLTEQLGGTLSYESQAGAGTTFRLQLEV